MDGAGHAVPITEEKALSELGLPFQLSLPVPDRRLVLAALDLLAVNTALLAAMWLSMGRELSWELLVSNSWRFLLTSALWLPLGFTFDAYDLRVASRFKTSVGAALSASAVTWAVTSVFLYQSFGARSPLPSVGAYLAFLLFLLTVGRGLYVAILVRPMFNRRALIIGAGPAGRQIARAILEHENGAYEVVGFVDDGHREVDHIIATETEDGGAVRSFSVLGPWDSLRGLIARYRITTLVVAANDRIGDRRRQTLMDCLESAVEIVPGPVLYEQLTGRVPIQHVGENWYVGIPVGHPGTRTLRRVVNRLFDLVVAGLGTLVFLPAFPVIAAAIYLDSPGPVFYKQLRVGRGGRPFWVYKFRSMIPNAENGRPVWARKDDPRVTRVGTLLRKTHLDELPQLFNILKGEMSVVGPRPERPEFVEELTSEIPFYRVRHAVKPGLAGWGAVRQGYGSSSGDALLKLQYDLFYIKNQSLWLDIVIFLKCVLDAVGLRGR